MSLPVKVSVRVGMEAFFVRCASRPRVAGNVKPAHAGAFVRLKRRTGGDWYLVDSDRLDAEGRFQFESESCAGRFKIVWKPQHAANGRGRLRRAVTQGPVSGAAER